MEFTYVSDQTFRGADYSEKKLDKREYEYCLFQNCTFLKSKIINSSFLETEFIDCNFSNANMSQSLFQDITFSSCKMLGLNFSECNQFNFAASFNHCRLNHCSFYRMNLKRARFISCQLKGADFTEANLKNTAVNECDLLDARFENTNLEEADFSHSYNYSIDPEINRVEGAIFSFPEVIGLLDKYDIKINPNE